VLALSPGHREATEYLDRAERLQREGGARRTP